MIDITNKVDCCGCTACVSKCPKGCITLKMDKEGFSYPFVNRDECISCNECIKVCPIKNSTNDYAIDGMAHDKADYTRQKIEDNHKAVLTYAAFNTDSITRENSTSGGVFSVLAEYIINCGGVVYGVILNDEFQVIHTEVNCRDDIAKLRGSKYVQSDQTNIYKSVKNRLDEGLMVLYSGTPCQVEGLNFFLGKEYSNLITVDIFCHGVGSPKYWNKYLDYMKIKYKSSIERIRFREKTYGYNSACMAVYFSNGKSSHQDHDSDLYWTAFSKCYIFRPSCYACKFKSVNHNSDFSIGDYWDGAKLGEDFKNANGYTLMLLHSNKAKKIVEKIHSNLCMKELDLYDALIVNGGPMPSKLISSSPKPNNRDKFIEDMDKMDLKHLVDLYLPLSLKKKLKLAIKPFLYKTGLLERIKRDK